MAERVTTPPLHPWDDPDQYPIHEEDNVPHTVLHDDLTDYVHDVVSVHVRDGWVTGDVCCYWIRGDWSTYLAPDVFLVDGERPEPAPRVYLAWVHEPIRLAVEIGSRSTLVQDEGPKLERYAEALRPREHLYFDPESGRLELHRWVEGGYVRVEPDERGWVWSQEAQAWFGREGPEWLRAYDRGGTPLLSHQELDAYARAETERRAAAELRAQREADLRGEAERRLAELQAELARLRGQEPAEGQA